MRCIKTGGESRNIQLKLLLVILSSMCWAIAYSQADRTISLNGKWSYGFNRIYDSTGFVPGLVVSPKVINSDTLWYRKEVSLPTGEWSGAILTLKGARFNPVVLIDRVRVAAAKGGMAPLSILLDSLCLLRRSFLLEIGLAPLDKMEADNASKIPEADLWRSNVASCLWDDVFIRCYKDVAFKRLFVYADTADKAVITYQLTPSGHPGGRMVIDIIDPRGKKILHFVRKDFGDSGSISIPLMGACGRWTPDDPLLYRVQVSLYANGRLGDRQDLAFGNRIFKVSDLQFQLNDRPVKLRAVSVVWHRWLRDPEAKALAWDTVWFRENIVKRLKRMGANTLRFHLGSPPERFIDLCDRYGVMVQAEWPFFHGMKSSLSSLEEQWPAWFDWCMRHPSVVLIHPWNETDTEDELKTAFEAIRNVSRQYPPLVISHRDVLHIHKYWWSLFENLGLYYDSYKQFPQPVMADEFGGNYLDGTGDMGAYPMVQPAFERFLGKSSNKEERLQFQALANGKVAEYWRRLDVAGFSPFVALSSPEDGNHWFLGPLSSGQPKPVWNALQPAYARRSISLELWDKNFLPGDTVRAGIYLFNDSSASHPFEVKIEVRDSNNKLMVLQTLRRQVKANSQELVHPKIILPLAEGSWQVRAILDKGKQRLPVISEWKVRTRFPVVDTSLRRKIIAVSDTDTSLVQLLKQHGFNPVKAGDTTASIFLTAASSLLRMQRDTVSINWIRERIDRGCHVIVLDAGPSNLGQGYRADGSLGPLQGVEVVKAPKKDSLLLPYGVTALFEEAAEPESHIHPATGDSSLWQNIPADATRLWNGLRGGLIVPAAELKMSGLGGLSYLRDWQIRGADTALIRSGNRFAYELEGYYAYAADRSDSSVLKGLKEKVRFLVDDAPSLKFRINPDAPVIIHDLEAGYKNALTSKAERIIPLVLAGNGLKRTPVYLVDYGKGKGSIIISQLLTKGRLNREGNKNGLYDIRFDPAAVQIVFNMMQRIIRE
ncbi:MAG: glycoside hydrolase [Chitinophagaceae bacterium]|nr:glycoside hydrolase [Chitinophagaceae bacterium]